MRSLPLPRTAREAMLRGLLSRHPAGPPLCAARGQNASQWWLCCCSAAKRPACVCGSAMWPSARAPPAAAALRRRSTCSPSPGIEKVPSCFSSCCLPLSVSILSLPMAGARCLLPSTSQVQGEGKAMSIRFIPFPDTLLHPRYQIAAGAVTSWQTFLSWMSGCVTY